MRQISLREFRTRGSKALEAVPQGETILLSGQQGPAYFLVPVLGDVADPPRWPHAGPDPKDIPFLALAHSAGAWLVTGNLRHFPEHTRGGVAVLSPTDYLAHLER